MTRWSNSLLILGLSAKDPPGLYSDGCDGQYSLLYLGMSPMQVKLKKVKDLTSMVMWLA